MMRAVPWAACVAVALVSCRDDRVGRVDAALLGASRVVLAVPVDAADQPTRALGPWALDDPPPVLALDEREVDALWVGLPDEALVRALPMIDLDTPLTARLGAACVGTAAARRDLAVPADAPVVRMGPEDSAPASSVRADVRALDAVVLSAAIDHRGCAPAGEPAILSPFAAALEALPEGYTVDGVAQSGSTARVPSDVVRIDDDRVLLATLTGVHLLLRGQVRVDRPGASFAPSRGDVWGLAVSRREGARVEVIAVGTVAGEGAIWTLAVDGAALSPIATATVGNDRLDDVAVGEDGTVVAVGRAGLIVRRAPGGSWFEEVARMPQDLLRIIATPDPAARFLIGGREATVYVGDAREGALRPSLLYAPGHQRFTVYGLAWTRGDAGVELWAGGLDGLFRGSSAGSWRKQALDLPLDYARCADGPDACGVRDTHDRVAVLAGADGAFPRLFVQLSECSGLAVMRPRDGCTHALAREAGGIGRALADQHTGALDVTDGVLTVVAEGGRVGELHLR